jgi:phthiocerol/phenolphthiocerol synthesis type-I polyketide synthase D
MTAGGTAIKEADTYRVLAHARGRYALWPANRTIPPSWREVLPPRPKGECVGHVSRIWTGLDPGSLTQGGSQRPKIAFGLMFFGGGEHQAAGDKFRLVIECARFADEHGFSAVWVPERHFTAMGCLYPNPAVLHAALARETRRIRLRAGSVVLPLHSPFRVAEEWAMVDNLSGGRVDLSFAAGWNPEDFALRPEAYRERHAAMFEAIPTVARLWRGEKVRTIAGDGTEIEVRVYPTPVQPELPFWITAAESPSTFQRAGELGANLLTHLFDLRVDKLAEMVVLYRKARQRSGFDPETGRVAVALHTFLGEDIAEVRRHAQKPYADYLKANAGLVAKLAASRGLSIDVASLTEPQLDEAVGFLFEKFLHGRSLLGTPESCAALVEELADKGVNEIACLVDFGPTPEAIVGSLRHLNALRELMAAPRRPIGGRA